MTDISAFANRLGKNIKHLQKWAKRQGIGAWRAYDRDIPQFPFSVDIYADRIHLQEYDTGWKIAPADYLQWLDEVKKAIVFVTGIPQEAIAFKTRRRQHGEQQYEKTGEQGEDFVIEEFGQHFWVNLHAYLDTGLFPDHRNTRRQVREEASGKRFLNLFAYTGSFTIYAVAGGAIASETVDLSNTYLDWAQRNFRLNGVDESVHKLVRADVFRYLEEAAQQAKQFDLIVMDPPSFSNSKKMESFLDVQRDHARLIRAAMGLLSSEGTLYFSTNLRTFNMYNGLKDSYTVKDISAKSVPEDYRQRNIHQCWQIRHFLDDIK